MQTTSAPYLRLRVDALRGAMSARGIKSLEYLADTLGVSHSMVKRIVNEGQQPSATFVAAVCLRLGLDFDVAFEAVEHKARAA